MFRFSSQLYGICFSLMAFVGCAHSPTPQPQIERTVNQAALLPLRELSISPGEVDPQFATIRGPHQVTWADENDNGRWLITLGGTNSLPSDLKAIAQVAAREGYSVVGVDYPNTVITVVCRESTKPDCFDRFREEIMFGKDVSDRVQVASGQGLLRRLESLIAFLARSEPRFAKIYNQGKIRWDLATVVGHSQGAGHAAFLGKVRGLEKVVMIAGPQDYFLQGPAPWIESRGQTAPQRHYALLHKQDPFEVNFQLHIFNLLTDGQHRQNLFLMKDETRDPHLDLITPKYEAVWKQILSSETRPRT